MTRAIIYALCDNGNRAGEAAVDGGASNRLGGRIFAAADEEGCAYLVEDGVGCGAPRRAGSPYCEHHHRRCRVAGGSSGERRRLREAEALANAVGGRRGRDTRLPPDPFLRRMENIARGFLRPSRSRIVPGGEQ
jgi:hypothetical protein